MPPVLDALPVLRPDLPREEGRSKRIRALAPWEPNSPDFESRSYCYIFPESRTEVQTWAENFVFWVNNRCDESGKVQLFPQDGSVSIDYASLFRSEITPLGSLATVNVTPVAKQRPRMWSR